MSQVDYDAIIIGAGPAGLTAGLYLARAGKKALCIEQGTVGGQIATTSHVENYPGFPGGTTGKTLSDAFEKQAVEHGLTIQSGRVDGLKEENGVKEVSITGFPYTAHVVIVATGMVQKLGIPGEEEYLGRGVSYCATCDGALFRERAVAVIGSTQWAIEEALHLSRFVSKLYLITKSSKLSPKDEHRAHLLEFPGLELVLSAKPTEILADMRGVTGVLVTCPDGEKEIKVDGVFICSGKRRPGTDFVGDLIDLDEQGFALVDENCRGNVPGIYAIGDVCQKKFRQVATAVGDGCIAGMDALSYIRKAARA